MGEPLHIDKDRKLLKSKRGVLLDTGALPHFLNPLAVSALQRREHFSSFRRDGRFERVQAVVEQLFPGKPLTSLANVIETLNLGPPTIAAARSILGLIRSNTTIVSATEIVAKDSLEKFVAHFESFPTHEAKLHGAADIYTAAAAIRERCVVLTEDFGDFSKIEGVEFLVGW